MIKTKALVMVIELLLYYRECYYTIRQNETRLFTLELY